MKALGMIVVFLGVILAIGAAIAARKGKDCSSPLIAWAMACTVIGLAMSISGH